MKDLEVIDHLSKPVKVLEKMAQRKKEFDLVHR